MAKEIDIRNVSLSDLNKICEGVVKEIRENPQNPTMENLNGLAKEAEVNNRCSVCGEEWNMENDFSCECTRKTKESLRLAEKSTKNQITLEQYKQNISNIIALNNISDKNRKNIIQGMKNSLCPLCDNIMGTGFTTRFQKEDERFYVEAKTYFKPEAQSRIVNIQDFLKDGNNDVLVINDCNGNYYQLYVRNEEVKDEN